MERGKLELAVGLFVVVGVLCLAYLSIKLGKLEVLGSQGYTVEALFESASGLKPGAPVEMAGVEVGRVKAIGLKHDRAAVLLTIQNGLTLDRDSMASIKTRGIIGDKFVAVSPGGSSDPLRPGDTIRDTESGLDLEQVIGQFIHGGVK
jgi:phospholipid/cholesterol/gamma-HCH transport system substrate-binding protein